MILHVATLEKFIPPFINFIGQYFNISDHKFWLKGDKEKYPYGENSSIYHLHSGFSGKIRGYVKLISYLHRAEKIILHNIFDNRIVLLLCGMPWLLKKCYWVIWGGDLYVHEADNKDWRWRRNEFFRRFFIPRLGHFVTHIRGDYELAQQWYGAKGQWHECFMYPSNLYREYPITPKPHEGTNILLGNSASSSNNHLDALEKLRPFASENIRIYCPLSYGDAAYGDQIAVAGKKIFGDKFIPLREFMPFEKYLELLAGIDVAVFNHNRQQGVGNITQLLGLGKKVYIRSDITTWDMLKALKVEIYDIDKFNLADASPKFVEMQNNLIGNLFSAKNLRLQWGEIYES